MYLTYRTGLSFYMHWDQMASPLGSFSWTYPLRLVAFILVFEYFFVSRPTWQRAPLRWLIQETSTSIIGPATSSSFCGESLVPLTLPVLRDLTSSSRRSIHQHHHTTKHPTALLAYVKNSVNIRLRL